MTGYWRGGWCLGPGRNEGQKNPLRLGASNGFAHRAALHQWLGMPGLGLALGPNLASLSEFEFARIGVQAVLAKQAGFQLHALLHLAQEVASHHR